MRELKFRAWGKDVKKFLYIELGPNARIRDNIWRCYSSHDDWEQYTGLKDKNGKEIYEGDIVKYSSYGENYIGQVAFSFVYDSEGYYIDKHYGWGIYRDDSSLEDFADDSLGDSADENMLCECVEVIGNIHENPELLEKK